MSRILRRPMFRGGGAVDSYGKGITAPLVPGYMGGGQIGGGIDCALNKLNTALPAEVGVTKSTLIVSPLPESSVIKIDFTIALEFSGTVYTATLLVPVKSCFAFL